MEETLSQWVEELKKGTKISTLSVDLSPLLKVKSFETVLNSLVSRVRPAKERRNIRSNLNHHEMRKNLASGRTYTQIQQKHATLHSEVEEAGRILMVETGELKKLVEKEEKLLWEERELKSKIALFRSVREERERRGKHYKIWANLMNDLIPVRDVPSSPSEESLKQESCNEEVKMVLLKLKLLKQKALIDKEDGSELKLGIWNFVESLLEKYNPLSVAKALTTITMKEVEVLDSITQQINLAEDAKSLSLKFKESGEFVDELRPHGILETVQSMLVEMSAKHLKKHFQNQKRRKELACTEESLKNIRTTLESVAKEKYKPEMVPEVLKYYELNLKTVGLVAIPSIASKLISDLQERVLLAKKAKDALIEKFNSIQSFEEKVNARNIEMKGFVLGGFHSLEYLDKEKEGISSLVAVSVNSLVLPTPFVKGTFSREVDVFAILPPTDLKALRTKCGIITYIPRNLTETPENYTEQFEECGKLIPYATSWGNIFNTIRLRKFQLKHQRVLLSDGLNTLKSMKNLDNSFTINEIKTLCQKAGVHDVQLENKIVPVLKQCEETNVEMALKLNKLKKDIDEWWNQPGDVLKEYLSKN